MLLVGSSSVSVRGVCNNGDEPVDGSILVVDSLGPGLYDAIVSASAVICSSGGQTGHMQSLCRSLGIPVLRVGVSTLHKLAGQVTVRMDRQSVIIGDAEPSMQESQTGTIGPGDLGSICVVIAGLADLRSMNAMAPRLKQANCYFIREEFLCLSAGLSPLDALSTGVRGAERYGVAVGEQLCAMTRELLPGQRLVMRLLDLRSDDAAQISKIGVAREPNPELGLHGARWLLREPHYPQAFRALRAHVTEQLGADTSRLTFAVPFINDADEFRRLRRHLDAPPELPFSVFVETPAAVHSVADFCAAGAGELFVGTKDLVQFYLAADRGNHSVASSYQTRHPAVLAGLRHVIESARGAGVLAYVFALGADVAYYAEHLPIADGFMMCTAELQGLARGRMSEGMPCRQT